MNAVVGLQGPMSGLHTACLPADPTELAPDGSEVRVLLAHAGGSIAAVAVTMPPWPGDSEALKVQGPWVQGVQE